jgi:DNA-binding transcriptional ArsR family regulator
MQTTKLRQTWPFHALSDEVRFRVMRLLITMGVPLRAGQLAAAINIPPNHLSKHLQVLELSGLTTTTRKGSAHYIYANVSSRANEAIFAAVLAMEDETGVCSEDLARLECSPNASDTIAQCDAEGAISSLSPSESPTP